MAKSQDKDPVSELDNLKQLVGGEEWVEALKVAKAHKEYLQGQVNIFVRSQNLIEAFGALCRLDDADKIFRLIKGRLEELQKEK